MTMPQVPSGLPPIPPGLPPIPPALPTGTVAPPSFAPSMPQGDNMTYPGDEAPTIAAPRQRRPRRTREQMEADRANLPSTPPPPPVPAQPEAPSQVPAAPIINLAADPGTNGTTPIPELRPQTTPPPIPVAEGNVKPKFWASAGATINIGNYESMKLDMGVSGIDYDASPEEIQRIMASADVGISETIEALMYKVIDRAREIKIARGIPVGEE